jgi:hypothetical protein
MGPPAVFDDGCIWPSGLTQPIFARRLRANCSCASRNSYEVEATSSEKINKKTNHKPRLDWSTVTPGPMVVDSVSFFK